MPGLDSGPNKCLLHVLILGERVRQPQPAVRLPSGPDSAQPAGPPAGLRLGFPAHQTAAAAHSQDGSESPTALPPFQGRSPRSPKASGRACADSQSKESPAQRQLTACQEFLILIAVTVVLYFQAFLGVITLARLASAIRSVAVPSQGSREPGRWLGWAGRGAECLVMFSSCHGPFGRVGSGTSLGRLLPRFDLGAGGAGGLCPALEAVPPWPSSLPHFSLLVVLIPSQGIAHQPFFLYWLSLPVLISSLSFWIPGTILWFISHRLLSSVRIWLFFFK